MDVIRSRKTTAVLCSLLCNGHIVQSISMSMENSSKLPWRMDETFTVCQYEASNGRQKWSCLSLDRLVLILIGHMDVLGMLLQSLSSPMHSLGRTEDIFSEI